MNCGTNAGLAWSNTAASTPFAGGTLCIGSNCNVAEVQRVGTLRHPYCDCACDFTISRAYLLNHGFGVGSTFYAQVISRDPGFAYPDNIGLTDALAITIAP